MFKWLNPLNWFKQSVADAADKKVDELLTMSKGKQLVVDGINEVIVLTDEKWSDEECRKYARGFKLAGKALTDLGESIDPDGDEGRKLSVDEFEVLIGDALGAFGTVADEAWLAKRREEIKAFIHQKLGV